MQLEDT